MTLAQRVGSNRVQVDEVMCVVRFARLVGIGAGDFGSGRLALLGWEGQ